MRNIILTLVCCILSSGCIVQSVHQFYSDEAKTEFPEIMGKWNPEILVGDSVSNKNISAWVFKSETLDTYDRDNIFSELEVTYFKIGNTYFMDYTAGNESKDEELGGNVYWGFGIYPVHSLVKLSIDKNKLVMTPLNAEWLMEKIKEGKLKLPYITPTNKDNNFLFTATQSEWMAFLEKFKDHPEAFDSELEFVLTKTK